MEDVVTLGHQSAVFYQILFSERFLKRPIFVKRPYIFNIFSVASYHTFEVTSWWAWVKGGGGVGAGRSANPCIQER